MIPARVEAPVRAVVTGASGFVGRHLVERLLREGVRVVAISRRPLQHHGVEAVASDYRDAAALGRTFEGVNVVFHLAARAHQADASDASQQYRQANVEATGIVAQACVAAGVRRLVFVSSIGVHGNRTDGRP